MNTDEKQTKVRLQASVFIPGEIIVRRQQPRDFQVAQIRFSCMFYMCRNGFAGVIYA